jgi:hypothetical protein
MKELQKTSGISPTKQDFKEFKTNLPVIKNVEEIYSIKNFDARKEYINYYSKNPRGYLFNF